MADPKDIHVDLLAIDMETGKYWLDPSQKQSAAREAIRKKNRDKWLTKQKAEAKREKKALFKGFDPSEPRDEHGRWTEGGGDNGGAGQTTLTDDEKMMLVSHNPTQEKLDKWHEQIEARSKELDDAGQAGNYEDEYLGQMAMSLNAYNASINVEPLAKGEASLMTVYDGNQKLRAASFGYLQKDHTALIEYFGAADKDAAAKTIEFMVETFRVSARSIEVNSWVDDKNKIALFEAAGFKQTGDPKQYGVMRLVKGDIPGAEAPSFEHAPLKVEMPAGLGVEFKRSVAGQLERMQKNVPAAMQHMKKAGIKIICDDLVTSAEPQLRGVTPRGWTPGTTWDQAEGLFDPSKSAAVVTEFLKSRDGGIRRSERIHDVLAHETGHAFDYSLTVPSIVSPKYIAAYNDDVKNIPADKRGSLGYFLQEGQAGRQEVFAETFANHLGNRTGPGDIRPYFPRTAALVKEAMLSGKWEKTEGQSA